MTDASDLVKKIADEDIAYVDIRFTDPRGKLQHVTVLENQVDEDFLAEVFMFDGSSIAGWKSIDKSDMKLMPDLSSTYLDPFYAEKTLCVHCDVLEFDMNEPYDRDPRGTAKKAEAYLQSSGIGDTSYWGPEAEFFLFVADQWHIGDRCELSLLVMKACFCQEQLLPVLENRSQGGFGCLLDQLIVGFLQLTCWHEVRG